MNRVEVLRKAREIVLQGWCQGSLGLTDRDVPANHLGNHEPVLDRNGKPVLDEKGVGQTVWCPTVKWSLVGALMVACDVGPSTYPNAAFGDIVRFLMPFVQPWTFSFGTYPFNFLGDFNDHSVPRVEEFDANGKKLRPKDLIRKYGSANHTTTVEDVVALLDRAIWHAESVRAWDKIKLNADFPLHVPYVDQTLSDNLFYNPDLARRITETGQQIVREMAAGQTPYIDTDSIQMNPCHPQNDGYLGPVLDQKVRTMTGRIAVIARIESVADLGDNLSLYRVLGQTVVGMKENGRHRFLVGEFVVYVPLDMLVPDAVLKHFGYWNDAKGIGALGGSKGNRVKARAFCKSPDSPDGTPSNGLIWKINEHLDYLDGPNMPPEVAGYYVEHPDGHRKNVNLGDDVTEFFALKVHGDA